MQHITITDLRTKSPELIKTLKNGGSIDLIYHSKVVGEISPKKTTKVFTKDSIKALKELAKHLNLPKISYKNREKIYRKHLMKKYGQGLS